MTTPSHLDRALQHLAQRENRQALELLQDHITRHPQDLAALNALGIAHRRLGHVNLAKKRLLQVLKIDPQHEAALVNLALLHLDAGDAQACLDVARQALAASPQSVNALVQQALALNELGQPEPALRSLQEAYALAQDAPEVRFNLALMLLQTGAWSLAWPLYESRFDMPHGHAAQLERQRWPGRWTGQAIAQDQHLMVCAEQGFGDTLQFCRLVLDLVHKGIAVVLEVPAPLVRLLHSLHPKVQVYAPYQYKGAFAYHVPLLSLPGVMRLTPAALPSPFVPYLSCAAQSLNTWRARCEQALGRPDKPRIGLVWRTRIKGYAEARRGLDLAQVLEQLPADLHCVVLQKDLTPAETQMLAARPNTWAPNAELEDFEDTAALCMLVDVVVSIDTSVAHLAGALGRPCWVLLPFLADWRWQLAQDHSPWYGQTRLFRQTRRHAWNDVLVALNQALQALLRGEPVTTPVTAQRTEAVPAAAAPVPNATAAAAAKPLLQQAYQAFTQNQWEAALGLCQQHLADKPQDAAGLHLCGVCLHKAGRSTQALQTLQEALALTPNDAALHNSLGIVLRHLKRHEQALAHYQQCIALGHRAPVVYSNLANVLRDLGRFEQALQHVDQALSLDPQLAEAQMARAQILCDLGRLDEALNFCQSLLEMRPAWPEALNVLGNIALSRKDFPAAARAYASATGLKPQYHEAYNNWGNALSLQNANVLALEKYDQALRIAPHYALAWYNKGNALRNIRQHHAAIEAYCRSIELDPEHAAAFNNRGHVYSLLRREDEALQDFVHALALDPTHIDALCNQSAIHKNRGDFAQAKACLEQALRIAPAQANILLNWGNVQLDQQDWSGALQHYNAALQLEPDNAAAHMNLGITQLLLGQFDTAWEHYEWRWQTDLLKMDQSSPAFPGQRWDGTQPIAGQHILLFWEQGLGDTLQFARYASALQAHGARVTLEVQAPLAEVLRTLPGSPKVITRISERPAADLHCPLLSLPLCFQRAGLPPPTSSQYLRADPLRIEQWKYRLQNKGVDLTRPRVGWVCSGNPDHSNDRRRSLPLAQLLPALTEVPGLQLVSLQKELRADDRQWLAEHPQADFQFWGDELKDFADTAALCACMDLVISVDTSVAHLAAALGIPCWILLPSNPDWRWRLEGETSAWYDSVRLYRQSASSTWSEVLTPLRTDVQLRFTARRAI